MSLENPLSSPLTPSNRFITTESILIGVGVGFCVVGSILFSQYVSAHKNTIFPGVYVNTVSVGNLTHQEAEAKITKELGTPPDINNYSLTLTADQTQIASSGAQLELRFNAKKAAEEAFSVGRSGDPLSKILTITQISFSKKTIQPKITASADKIEELVTSLKLAYDNPGEKPAAELKLSKNPNSLVIHKGKIGTTLDFEKTVDLVSQAIERGSTTISAITSQDGYELSEDEVQKAREKSLKLVGKSIKIKHDTTLIQIPDQELLTLLKFPEELDDASLTTMVTAWAPDFDRQPVNAIFEYNKETLSVQRFAPHRTGRRLAIEPTKGVVIDAISQLLASQELSTIEKQPIIDETMPDVPLSALNDLGISERIGLGESKYAHSIPNRIHNVALTTQNITDTIVKSGEEFSFNKTLGEVSASTGYRAAYVIRNGRTELGDGGGVCQVSSTLFRALLNAGLNITRRRPHSYRVSYYELNSDPGFDATVYAGDVDLRFVNDTDHAILIHARADSNALSMYVEIYGTSDGRTSEISNYKKWDESGPAATQYFEDPSLPAGTLKQIDWSAGGIKTSFDWVVKDKDGTIIHKQNFYSNFRPWSAKYLKGTGN